MLSSDNECDKPSLGSTPPWQWPALCQFYNSPQFLGQYSHLRQAAENNWESAFSFGCQGCEGNILESELNLDKIITNIILSNGINILSGFYGYNTPTTPTEQLGWMLMRNCWDTFQVIFSGNYTVTVDTVRHRSVSVILLMSPVSFFSQVGIHPYIIIENIQWYYQSLSNQVF